MRFKYNPEIPLEYQDVAYQVSVNEHTLADNLPRGRAGPPGPCRPRRWSRSRASLGALNILPPELLQDVLVQLDICSVMEFRLVNKHAADVVQSLPQYRVVITHARTALHGTFCIGTDRYITLDTLYEMLCTQKCNHCDNFAGYLYVFTCERLCYHCFTSKDRYLPRERTRLIKEYGIPEKSFSWIPRMHIVPGRYGPLNRQVCRMGPRATLFDTQWARLAAYYTHKSQEAWEIHVNRYTEQTMTRAINRYIKRGRAAMEENREVRDPRFALIEEQTPISPLRWVAIVRVPWFDRRTQTAQWGFSCLKCLGGGVKDGLPHQLLFTPESFKKHWDKCKLTEGDGGLTEVPSSPA